MSEYTPSLVGIFELRSGGLHRNMEFRLLADSRAAVTVFEPDAIPFARSWYVSGFEYLGGEYEAIRGDNGPAFMRTLLKPYNMSYVFLRDESVESAGSRVEPREEMGDGTPASVGMYMFSNRFKNKGHRRTAEFRLMADGRASVTVFDPYADNEAWKWFEDGIEIQGTKGVVRADDGPAFMRALLQPTDESRIICRDESSNS
ncbi:hypothetical protein [Nocardia altamirensis]|uniref:hypothetical protein n=1 Tax=Nocardia altamirensis TaxID=472158 RepID=UPI00114CFCD3|nr:hypothetical protein [Nocardia altamirensis]